MPSVFMSVFLIVSACMSSFCVRVKPVVRFVSKVPSLFESIWNVTPVFPSSSAVQLTVYWCVVLGCIGMSTAVKVMVPVFVVAIISRPYVPSSVPMTRYL